MMAWNPSLERRPEVNPVRVSEQDPEDAKLTASKRRSWMFSIGAPYVIALPIGLWMLVRDRLPLWANTTLAGLALALAVVYFVVAIGWVFKNVRDEMRSRKTSI